MPILETWQLLGAVDPKTLAGARLEAHFGAQVAAAVATSLLDAAPDYGHTAFHYNDALGAAAGRLVPLKAPLRGALRIAEHAVVLTDAYGEVRATIPLEGLTLPEAYERLRAAVRDQLGGVPPRPIKESEYSMPAHPLTSGARFSAATPAHRELGKYFANAAAFLRGWALKNPGASDVRIWPHHFDIATLNVFDPDADPEAARSVGVGMSPGDETVAEPYFYVLPWPKPEAEDLPALEGGGYWHTDGFVAAVLPASTLVERQDVPGQVERVTAFVDSAVAATKDLVGLGDRKSRAAGRLVWYKALSPDELPEGRVKAVTCGLQTVCMTHVDGDYHALDNRCPHQKGPLGEGSIENGKLRCPWHGWDFDPKTGKSPPPFEDGGVDTYEVEVREDGVYVGLEEAPAHERTVTDVMAETMTNWGIRHCFGMVGHSNLGLADALRRQEKAGKLSYFGIRHEGTAAFAASAYGKLTGRPAACLAIAGPGATNLLTGLWDAHVDRAPVLALTGQVQTQVMGPGAFQEVDLPGAFGTVAKWSQSVLHNSRHAELVNLGLKSAILERGVAHLIFPDDVQTKPAAEGAKAGGPEGRMPRLEIAPPRAALDDALQALREAKRPAIIVGHGARFSMPAVLALADQLDCPVLTTFKGKGLVSDHHPLGCGVLGRSGTPIASWFMNEADLLVVFGASFSNHTGISSYKKTIHVDADPMTLGRFHSITVPVLGDIEVTANQLAAELGETSFVDQRPEIAERWRIWRDEKESRRHDDLGKGLGSAQLFATLSDLVPEDAIMCVDVGNNTYSFGRYFECKRQAVLMSGYLGSIGFSLPAAIGAWAATQEDDPRFSGRKVVSVSGDGGFGQYLADFTTAVKYGMNITHVLLNNSELGKISKEQRAGEWEVWQTSLHNPNFAKFADNCGAKGIRVTEADKLQDALREGLSHGGPALVEVMTDAELI